MRGGNYLLLLLYLLPLHYLSCYNLWSFSTTLIFPIIWVEVISHIECVREIWSNLFDGFGVPPSTHHLSLLQRKKCEIWEAKNHDAFMISATTQQPMQPHHLMYINRINHPLWESYNNLIIGLRVGCLHESNTIIECLTQNQEWTTKGYEGGSWLHNCGSQKTQNISHIYIYIYI
jgi:hypothetical protein